MRSIRRARDPRSALALVPARSLAFALAPLLLLPPAIAGAGETKPVPDPTENTDAMEAGYGRGAREAAPATAAEPAKGPAEAKAADQGQARKLVSLAAYPGGRRAAYSFTFDDGTADQIDEAAPLLDQHGFKATFFLYPGSLREEDRGKKGKYGSLKEWRAVADKGHEIGNHSWSHAFLKRIQDEEKLTREIEGARAFLEERMGQPIPSFCFPFNQWTPDLRERVRRTHLGARHGYLFYGGKDFTAEKANAMAEKVLAEGGWGVPMVHGLTANFKPTAPSVLAAHLKHLDGLRDQLWIAPFGAVLAYRTARDAAALRILEETPNRVTFALTLPPLHLSGTARPAVTESPFPLTVLIQPTLPEGGALDKVLATQGEATLPTTVADGRIRLDVAPTLIGSGKGKAETAAASSADASDREATGTPVTVRW